MSIPPPLLAYLAAGAGALGLLALANRWLSGRARAVARWVGAAALVGVFFGALRHVGTGLLGLQVAKAAIALAAAAAVVHEQRAAGRRRPISDRWKRFVGVCLALAALTAYWNGFRSSFPGYYHRWEHYHYHLGAKYFRELGYDGLYRCTVVAEDELGVIEGGPLGPRRLDLSAEVRRPGKKVRDLGGDDRLHPVDEILAHPEACKRRFSPDRWESYKADVAFFRRQCEPKLWDDMQEDKGYNPPPVWTLWGHALASLAPPGRVFDLPLVGPTLWVQLLAMLDVGYLAGTFAALAWAFGLRVALVAAIFLGAQGWAPALWTQGAFLRQDWLFWLVLSACAARKRWFVLAGAALAHASLLRVFPALTGLGWVVLAGWHLARHRALPAPMWRALAGAALATALLVPASVLVTGPDAYRQFAEHTLQLHDRTPGTNRMGLRMLLAQELPFELGPLGRGAESGRMKYARDGSHDDPFGTWMDLRRAREARLRPLAWGILALSAVGFALALRRVRSLWIAQALAHLWIPLLSQVASYYYASMILLVPLTRAHRQLEVPLFALAALSQGLAVALRHADDMHWAESLACLLFCAGLVAIFARRPTARRPGGAPR